MRSLPSWDVLLAAPAPRDHLVQLYTTDDALLSTVSRFVEHGVTAGDAVVIFATAPHTSGIERRLAARSIDVAALARSGQLTRLDAHECLERFMADGLPDAGRFHATVAPVVEAARAAGFTMVRGFGEMVDILHRRSNLAGALRLEELWNDLIATLDIALLCAYAVDPFDRAAYHDTLPGIGHAHSHLMPVADADRLERAIDRALVDVFGVSGDTGLLRELFVRQIPDRTSMPSAQGALFALRSLDTRLADAVLERAGAHYHR